MGEHLKTKEITSARCEVLTEGAPIVMDKFNELHDEVCKDGVLDFKTKTLVAIEISISIRCIQCIHHHIKLAVQEGASREEVIEAIEVAILIGGGPSTSYGAIALEVYDEFSAIQ